MMGCRMMLCEVISQVGFTGPQIEAELLFSLPILQPLEPHIHQFGALWLIFRINKPFGGGVICLDWCFWLRVTHFNKDMS
jgi:hypothetical protein